MEKKGYFIAFEGIDGCGKGTQIKRLKELFEEKGIDSLFTREPGGIKLSEKIRELLLDKENSEMTDTCEMMLFAASRSMSVEKLIVPALKEGKVVVCDRYVDSSIAYQGGARGLGVDLVRDLNLIATGGLNPDLTILLDLAGEIGASRNEQMGGKDDRMESNGVAFQNKVRQVYLENAALAPDRYLIVDASKSRDEIFDVIKSELEARGVLSNASVSQLY